MGNKPDVIVRIRPIDKLEKANKLSKKTIDIKLDNDSIIFNLKRYN